MKKMTKNQSGFTVLEILLVIISVLVIGVVGWTMYDHNHARIKPATTTTDKTNRQADHAQQSLIVKEWGIQLPLADTIKDAYYTVAGSNRGDDGLPNTAWVGLSSLNSNGCDISSSGPTASETPVGAIMRVAPTEHDPITGVLYTQQAPGGVMLGKYYYAYAPWKNNKCASIEALQSINSAFVAGTKRITATARTIH